MINEITMQMVTPQKDRYGRLYFTTNDKDINKSEFRLIELLKRERRMIYPDIYKEADISSSQFHRLITKIETNGKVGNEKDENGKIWYFWKD